MNIEAHMEKLSICVCIKAFWEGQMDDLFIGKTNIFLVRAEHAIFRTS
jgi:hypothetical protein